MKPANLKPYRAPWEGQLILACRKCQKKLKKVKHPPSVARLKKTIKVRDRLDQAPPIHVLNVPCMDLCPKGGVTVCNPTHTPARLYVLRSREDIEKLRADYRPD